MLISTSPEVKTLTRSCVVGDSQTYTDSGATKKADSSTMPETAMLWSTISEVPSTFPTTEVGTVEPEAFCVCPCAEYRGREAPST